MPIELNTLFCNPQDVWDYMSTEGVDLRLDDHNLASGQIIQTTAVAAVGATSVTVIATLVNMLNGTQLTFDGANMGEPVTAILSAAAGAGSTSLSISALTTAIPAGAQARDSGVNAATAGRLLVACRQGTSRVKLYCNGRYDDSQLVLAGSVLDWATVIASRRLCMRRVQGVPKSVEKQYEETMKELERVQAGQLAIEDIGTRGVDWPSMSNITVNPAYDGMRVRVQRPTSEATPTHYGQYVDFNSILGLWR